MIKIINPERENIHVKVYDNLIKNYDDMQNTFKKACDDDTLNPNTKINYPKVIHDSARALDIRNIIVDKNVDAVFVLGHPYINSALDVYSELNGIVYHYDKRDTKTYQYVFVGELMIMLGNDEENTSKCMIVADLEELNDMLKNCTNNTFTVRTIGTCTKETLEEHLALSLLDAIMTYEITDDDDDYDDED